MLRNVVIVGGSLAGLRAAETLRNKGFDGSVTMINGEAHLPVLASAAVEARARR